MNIFFLSRDPDEAATYMVDKHVVKMVLETAQLLSTAHRVLDGKDNILPDEREGMLYKATHMNHPSAKWARESVENYSWLVDHLIGLLTEYTYRYEKIHKCADSIALTLIGYPSNLKEREWTEPPCAMPDEYKKFDDPVLNYRLYYALGKKHLHSWKKRSIPEWIREYEDIV